MCRVIGLQYRSTRSTVDSGLRRNDERNSPNSTLQPAGEPVGRLRIGSQPKAMTAANRPQEEPVDSATLRAWRMHDPTVPRRRRHELWRGSGGPIPRHPRVLSHSDDARSVGTVSTFGCATVQPDGSPAASLRQGWPGPQPLPPHRRWIHQCYLACGRHCPVVLANPRPRQRTSGADARRRRCGDHGPKATTRRRPHAAAPCALAILASATWGHLSPRLPRSANVPSIHLGNDRRTQVGAAAPR